MTSTGGGSPMISNAGQEERVSIEMHTIVTEEPNDLPEICVFSAQNERMEFPSCHVHKIPYLEAALSGKYKQVKDDTGMVHLDDLDPTLLRTIFDYVESDRTRYLLTHLHPNQTVAELVRALDFLCVKDPSERDPAIVESEMCTVSAYAYQRRLARDAAASFALGVYLEKPSFRDLTYQIRLFEFIFSEPGRFRSRIRSHLWAVCQEKVLPCMTVTARRSMKKRYSRSKKRGRAAETSSDEFRALEAVPRRTIPPGGPDSALRPPPRWIQFAFQEKPYVWKAAVLLFGLLVCGSVVLAWLF